MKKNISINISGIIFHIEEDGFEALKNYLDSINKYFSHYEDSKEIIDDIEGRIAEIFLSKLKEDKQVITAEDVESLIITMGTTADFEVSIDVDKEDLKSNEETESTEEESGASQPEDMEPPKKLYRDKDRRILGGVAAGIAHYFNVDPFWIRLLIVGLLFTLFIGGIGITISTFIAYIALWIALPEAELEEDTTIKKLYRDPENKVLGGVAGGLAAYFGTEVVVLRLLFFLAIFLGGSGILAYIILWIITPEAKTITEKMQMQGEPVTLSNIETNVKRSLRVEEGEESAFVKIILFPFRFIALLFEALGKALKPFLRFLVELLRVLAGVKIFFTGFVMILGLIVIIAGFYGVVIPWYNVQPVELDKLYQVVYCVKGIVPDFTVVAIFFTGFIPALVIAFVGLSIIAKRWLIKSYTVWSLLGLWIIASTIVAVSALSIVNNHKKEASVKETRSFELASDQTPILKLNEVDEQFYDAVDLRLRGHSDSTFNLVLRYRSLGANRSNAQKNAQMISYQVLQKENKFIFDSNITIREGDFQFRFQRVDATFYIPHNRVFKMDQDLEEILINTMSTGGYRNYQIGGHSWLFTEEGIFCETCKQDEGREPYKGRRRSDDFSFESYKGNFSSYDFDGFNQIEADGVFEISVMQGDEYDVKVKATDRLLNEVEIYESGGKLVLDYDGNRRWFSRRKYDKIGVAIVMPDLSGVNLSGSCRLHLSEMSVSNMVVDMGGASYMTGDLTVGKLDLELSGASKLTIQGRADELEGDLSGASNLEAKEMVIEYIDLETSGASKATVFGTKVINIDAGGASKVFYDGGGDTRIDRSGAGRVSKKDF